MVVLQSVAYDTTLCSCVTHSKQHYQALRCECNIQSHFRVGLHCELSGQVKIMLKQPDTQQQLSMLGNQVYLLFTVQAVTTEPSRRRQGLLVREGKIKGFRTAVARWTLVVSCGLSGCHGNRESTHFCGRLSGQQSILRVQCCTSIWNEKV
jgi:hypothetical protein